MPVTATSKTSVDEKLVKKADSEVPDGYVRIWRNKGSVAMPAPWQDIPADSPRLYLYVRKSQDMNNLLIDKIETGGEKAKAAYQKAKSDANDYRTHLARVAEGEKLPNFIPGVTAVAK